MAKRRGIVSDSNEALGAAAFKLAMRGAIESAGIATSDIASSINRLRGIKLNKCLPLQYLLGLDSILTGRMMSLVGSFGSCKTILSWELGRFFIESGGFVIYINAEKKPNFFQFRSLFYGKEGLLDENHTIARADNIEQFLGCIRQAIDSYPSIDPSGNTPVLIIGDSLASNLTEDTMDNIEGNDLSQKCGDAQAANRIKQDMIYISKKLEDLPITLLLINHQKVKTEIGGGAFRRPGMPAPKSEPGGEHQRFAYTWLLESNKGETKKTAFETNSDLMLRTKKSGFSATGLKAGVTYTTIDHSIESGVAGEEPALRQEACFDWDTALIDLLNEPFISKTILHEIMDINIKDNTVSSEVLGLEKATFKEAGAAIHNSAQLCAALQSKLLKVTRIDKTYSPKVKVEPNVNSTPIQQAVASAPAQPITGQGAAGQPVTESGTEV